MASLLSVNGVLKSLYEQATHTEARSHGYKSLEIGQPLVVRYLHLFTKWNNKNKNDQELMISTFVKTAEEKVGAAETINYFNPRTEFINGVFDLTDIGGQCYGHELCYYTKSYLGESIRLTTKIMELDKIDNRTIDALKSGITTISGLPTFSSFLPYAALATVGVSIFAKIAAVFNRDDVILEGHNLDLHFRRINARCLQSGRILCVPQRKESEFIGKYRLNRRNELVSVSGSSQYHRSTYFVFQINNERNDAYDKFDYLQNAAELLEKTNRGGDPREFLDLAVSMFQAHSDIDILRKIEALSVDMDEEKSRKKAKALFKHMGVELRHLYESRLNVLLGESPT